MSQPSLFPRMTPFSIHIEEETLADLRDRIRKTRWPDQLPGIGWEQGVELDELRALLGYWADGFDWRAQERDLTASTTIAPSSRTLMARAFTSSTSGRQAGMASR